MGYDSGVADKQGSLSTKKNKKTQGEKLKWKKQTTNNQEKKLEEL